MPISTAYQWNESDCRISQFESLEGLSDQSRSIYAAFRRPIEGLQNRRPAASFLNDSNALLARSVNAIDDQEAKSIMPEKPDGA